MVAPLRRYDSDGGDRVVVNGAADDTVDAGSVVLFPVGTVGWPDFRRCFWRRHCYCCC